MAKFYKFTKSQWTLVKRPILPINNPIGAVSYTRYTQEMLESIQSCRNRSDGSAIDGSAEARYKFLAR